MFTSFYIIIEVLEEGMFTSLAPMVELSRTGKVFASGTMSHSAPAMYYAFHRKGILWRMLMYSRLIDMISRLILMYSRLKSGLTVFFSGSISSFQLELSFLSSETMIVHIDEVSIRLGESYGL